MTTPDRLDTYRAYRIRSKIRSGQPLTDIDRAWLTAYEQRDLVRRQARREGPQTADPHEILRVGCLEHGVSPAAVLRRSRGRQEVEVARAVIAVALWLAGCPIAKAGSVMGRRRAVLYHLTQRARARPGIREQAQALLVKVRGAVAGEVVMIPVVVGSAAWRYLDSLDELDEITAAVIRRRLVADVEERRYQVE